MRASRALLVACFAVACGEDPPAAGLPDVGGGDSGFTFDARAEADAEPVELDGAAPDPDVGALDLGASEPDVGAPDAEALDTGTGSDAEARDAAVDAGTRDAAVDGGTPDAAVDAGARDAAVDAGTRDAAVDAGARDAAVDAGARDASADAAVDASLDAAVDASLDAAVDAGVADGGVSVDAGAQGAILFRFPIHADDRGRMSGRNVFGVDHDPMSYSGVGRIVCRNYEDRGFPRCYDGHDGSDFMLVGGFTTMDNGSARIVAAAGGVVLRTADGNYDRCHADISSLDVSCDGNPMRANYVVLGHAGGWESWYWHLKSGTVSVQVGQTVSCGDVLGLVGSSGYSSAPHLHFEVHDPNGAVLDPFAGPRSQPETYWVEQNAGDDLPADRCHPAFTSPP